MGFGRGKGFGPPFVGPGQAQIYLLEIDDVLENSVPAGTTWHAMVAGAGTGVWVGTGGKTELINANAGDLWINLRRTGITIDLSAIAPGKHIFAVTLRAYPDQRSDYNNLFPPYLVDWSVNLVAFAPVNPLAYVAADFTAFGTSVFAVKHTYTDWVAPYRDFMFNPAGVNYVQYAIDHGIPLTLGMRDETYDIADQLTPGAHDPPPPWLPGNQNAYLTWYDMTAVHSPQLLVATEV